MGGSRANLAKAAAAIALVAAAALPSAPADAARFLEEIREDYHAVLAEFPCYGGDGDSGTYFPWLKEARTAAAVEEAWPQLMEWASASLEADPAATGADLTARLGPPASPPHCASTADWWSASFEILPLSSPEGNGIAVAVNFAAIGTWFVVAPASGASHSVVWSLPDPCRRSDSPDTSWGRGERHRRLTPLPPTADGRSRFQVLSMLENRPSSCCSGQHLSFWEWDGRRPENVLWKSYSVAGCPEDGAPGEVGNIRLVGDVVEVAFRGHLQTVTRSCDGSDPRAVWRVQVSDSGVEDLGEDWHDRHLQFVDGVLARVLRQESTADAIAAEAASELYAQLRPQAQYLPKSAYLGMGSFRSTEDGGVTVGVLDTDSIDHRWSAQFFIVTRSGRPYVKAAHVVWLERPPPDPAASAGDP